MSQNPPQASQEMIDFANSVFGLARDGSGGGSEQLAAYLDGGLTPNLTNQNGDTLLMLAAYCEQPDNVRVLLEHGADVSRVNDKGQTALGAAVYREDEGTVRALLAAGADPSAGSPSAVDIASQFERTEMAALLQP